MAADAERLIAKRTALLVRFQEAREQRKQAAMMEARAAHEAASARRDQAERAVAQAQEDRVAGLRAAYDKLAASSVTGAAIQTLRATEEALAQEITRRERQVAQAEAAAQRAEQDAQEAYQAYMEEAMRTRKRKELADDKRRHFRQVEGKLEEEAVEEEMGDRFASMSGAMSGPGAQ